jgi:hypothetical protein
VDEGDAEARERAELGADDHRADDQDRGVLVDADRGEERRDHHEREERRRELDAFVRARLDLLPDDGVGRSAPGALDRDLGVLGDLRVDLVERDRPVLGDAERAEIGDNDGRVLARDVGEDEVAGGVARGGLEQDDVADRLGALEQRECALGPAAARRSADGSWPRRLPVQEPLQFRHGVSAH